MRIEQLTFTRFIAALFIVYYHYGRNVYFLDNEPMRNISKITNIGVSYFFILSGFVMIIAYNARKIDFKKYYINRIARIYPLYLLALLIVLFGKVVVKGKDFDMTETFLSIFVIQSWFKSYPLCLNFPGWSLSVEFFFYGLFPFLANFIYNKLSIVKTTVGIILIWIISQLLFFYLVSNINSTDDFNFAFYLPVLHLNQFMIGNLAGILFVKYNDKMQSKFNGYYVVVIMLLLAFLFSKNKFEYNYYHNGLFAIIFAIMIFLISSDTGWMAKLLRKKSLVFLGEISFGIYILQMPVRIASEMIFKRLNIPLSLYLYTAVLVVVSILTYYIIEKPFRKIIVNWSN